ncbi:MAG: hypothetical protein ABFC89_08565 [Methanospirillum sp.]
MNPRFAAVLVVLSLSVATAGCAALFGPSAEYPAIVPAPGAASLVAADHTFEFEGGAETVGATIDSRVLAGARAGEKTVLIRGDVPEKEWVAGAYRAQTLDHAQDRFYDDLLARLREIRDRRGLDGDRYLELVAAAVQQLTYVSAPGTAAKYPVETWADGSGDCDDKVLLLAGLLEREGYRVALLVFLPESHMALGVGCPAGSDYGGSGYAYLEVTNGSYVGVVPDRLGDGSRLASTPLVVPIGNGTALYGATRETAAIEGARQTARARVDELGPEIDRRRSALETDRRRLETLRSAGDRDAFDAAYERYNADAAACDRLVEEYNRAADLLNRTAPNRYDRAGAAAYVSTQPL